jgi:hypothetical protein
MGLISPMEIFMSTPMEIIFMDGDKKPAQRRAGLAKKGCYNLLNQRVE